MDHINSEDIIRSPVYLLPERRRKLEKKKDGEKLITKCKKSKL